MGKSSIREGWNKAAVGYRDALGVQLDRVGEHLERILPRDLPGPVLDLACGPGTVLFHLGKTRPGLSGIGCDFSLEMGKLALNRNPGAHAVVADQDALPFGPGTLGGVVSSMGTIFSSDHGRQIQEIASMLKSGGVLAFSAWGERKDCGLRQVSEAVTMNWPYPVQEAVPALDSPFSTGSSNWLNEVATRSGLLLLNVWSCDLLFEFGDLSRAAEALVHTGRFALLLKDHPEQEKALTDLTKEHFLPFLETSGRVRLSNRYHLFLLRKNPVSADVLYFGLPPYGEGDHGQD